MIKSDSLHMLNTMRGKSLIIGWDLNINYRLEGENLDNIYILNSGLKIHRIPITNNCRVIKYSYEETKTKT